MARSDTRYSIYPAPKAIEIVGKSSRSLNQAIECWASQLARAMADNAKKFGNYEATSLTERTEDMYALKEWCVLGDALRGKPFDPDFANPAELVATAVEEANRLEDIGAKWFSTDFPYDQFNHDQLIDTGINELAVKLRGLDYPHAWAVILVVQWFWENHEEGIDMKEDEWWTWSFRRHWIQKNLKPTSKRKR